MPRVVALWKEALGKLSEKAAQSLADPVAYENLFPDFRQSIEAEEYLKEERREHVPAAAYPTRPVRLLNFDLSEYILPVKYLNS